MGEQRLLAEREQLKAAIDWTDKERQSLKRGAFNATRQGGSGRGFHITLMKKKGEWLYAQRCLVRNRLAAVNAELKELRRESNGKPGESLHAAFFRVARETLPAFTFEKILHAVQAEQLSDEPEVGGKTVIEKLKEDMDRFMESCSPRLTHPDNTRHRPPIRHRPAERESQEDFALHQSGAHPPQKVHAGFR